MRKHELIDGTVVVQVGSCVGTKEASEHVRSILRYGGIEPVLHGSRAYAICVPADCAEQARQLFREDPRKEIFHISVCDV